MTHAVWHRAVLPFSALLVLAAPAVAQVAAGYSQDFQSGSTAGWTAGGGPVGGFPPVPPMVVGGGRLGATDLFLQVTSNGFNGPGARLTTLNRSGPWTGDYRAAGVSAIEMWVRNFGSTDLFLRLAFLAPLGAQAAVSTAAFVLPGGGSWTPVSFSLAPGAIAAFDPFGVDLETTMRNVAEVRLMHSPAFEFPPDAVAGVLGVDDMRILGGATLPPATTVPEPATMLLTGTGLALLAALGRRRRR